MEGRSARFGHWSAGAALCVVALVPQASVGRPPGKATPAPAGERTVPTWPLTADPRPLVTPHYVELFLTLDKAQVRVLKTVKHTFAKPQAILPRYRGRFEVKIYSATGLLRDVVRFDFPLTAAQEDRRDPLGVRLGQGVSARTSVRIPFDDGVASAVIHDRLGHGTVRVDLSRLAPRRPVPRPRESFRTRSLGTRP